MPLQPNFLERFLISRGEVPGLLLDVALSSQQFWALVAAMEIGFFEPWVGSEEKICTVDELCAHTEASQRGIRRLVHALEPLGYLDKAMGGYRLSAAARRSLPLDQLSEIAPFFRYQMLASQEAARGVQEVPEDGIIGWELVRSGEVGRSYQAAMRWIASQSVEEVVDNVDLPEGAERMLDVGGSHGLYTLAFCREHPELRGTVLDWEIGLENARQTLNENPELADRIDLVERISRRRSCPLGMTLHFWVRSCTGSVRTGIGTSLRSWAGPRPIEEQSGFSINSPAYLDRRSPGLWLVCLDINCSCSPAGETTGTTNSKRGSRMPDFRMFLARNFSSPGSPWSLRARSPARGGLRRSAAGL